MDERYRLQERLGAGGMSEVWRAHDQVLGRDVAVKVLAPGADADPARSARIRMEARAAAGLVHPHIVGVYDYGEAVDADGRARPYVVMELVEGTSLDDLLDSRTLPWDVATRICAQVAAALASAHARGVVHRDVKPGNVMVTPDGVKLVDFGISAAAGAVDETNGEVLGTPAYLAPERLDGGPVRVATDVYALGLLLYRALAGRLPWSGTTVTEMVGDHLYTEPAPLPRIAGLPPQVADLCRRALAKRPEDRPTAAEAARILGTAVGLPAPELLSLPSVGAQAAAGTVAIKPPRARRRPVVPTTAMKRRSLVPAVAAAVGPLRNRRAAAGARSAVRAHPRPALLVAAVIAAFALLSSFVWWPSGDPRAVRAEAATVPATSGTAPAPKVTTPATRTADTPVVRKVKPAAAPKAKPRAAPPKAAAPKAAHRKVASKPKTVVKSVKKPAKVKNKVKNKVKKR